MSSSVGVDPIRSQIRSGGRGGGFMFWTGFAIRYRNMPDSQLKFPAFCNEPTS